ncbi:hypothetical protein MMC13_005962 [Lambiella insularis]|nr:hypothetical protein [Lambiella insularis]
MASPLSFTPIFHLLDTYPWSTDPEFQHGLRAILGPPPSPSQAEQLTLRARCFYYSRKHNTPPIDFDAYRDWHARHGSPVQSAPDGPAHQAATSTDTAPTLRTPGLPGKDAPPAAEGEPPAPYPVSFNQIVELITTGRPVPGIKEIPDTVLEGQASRAVQAKRKKPWETGVGEGDVRAAVNAVGEGKGIAGNPSAGM